MPGFIIHLAVAKEYMRKHKNEIKNEDEFIEGTIAPDFGKDKYESHYHNYGEICAGLNYLLENADFDINSDYGKGYFLHILVDNIFYGYDFKKETYYVRRHSLGFYKDYDCLNKPLMEKYNLHNIPDKVKKFNGFSESEPQFLKLDRVVQFIDFVSDKGIDEQIKKIRETGEPVIKEIKMKLDVNFCGIKMRNPITVASGTFGYGREHAEYIDLNKLGGIVTKGTSLKPKIGNKPPRVAETEGGMINSIGLENPGLEHFVNVDLPFLKKFDTPIIVNCFGGIEGTVEAYVQICKELDNLPIDGVEINLSCPNVSAGCLAFGTTYEGVKEITSACRKVLKNKPLIVKLTPNVADITLPAKGAEEAGADGISLINTLTSMKIDIETRKPILGNNIGGLSGPAVKPVAVRMVYQASHAVKIPVMGLGGIMTGEDVIEFMLAGATCVSMGTANLIDPEASIKAINDIENYMKRHEIEDINSIIGAVEMN